MAKIAVHQMCSSINPFTNVVAMVAAVEQAAKSGARFYFAPEMSVMLDRDRARGASHVAAEEQNQAVAALGDAARANRIWIHAGSIPVLADEADGKFANRSLVFNDLGQIVARYDKIHLFDVNLSTGEAWRESSAYVPGSGPVVADTCLGPMGLTICYDMRFPALYSVLARENVSVIAAPASFTVPTGKAHWHVLLRARAIEAAAFVIAAAQSGHHEDGRSTYGHSLVIDPWGEVLLDMGEGEGLGFVELDLNRIAEVRAQIPVHANRRDIGAVIRQG